MLTNVATGNNTDISFNALKAFVSKPQYSSFGEAFNSKEKTKAIALTNRMTYLRTGYILFDQKRVASYDHDRKVIKMVHKIFLPEIMQHMVDHNEHYEVLV
jgi:hypothetical protein